MSRFNQIWDEKIEPVLDRIQNVLGPGLPYGLYAAFIAKGVVILAFAFFLGRELNAFTANLDSLQAPEAQKLAFAGQIGLKDRRLHFNSCFFQRGSHVVVEFQGSTHIDHIFYVGEDCRITYLKYPGGARLSGAIMWRES